MLLGQPQKAHHAPGSLVGEPDEADLAVRDEFAERGEDLVDGMGLAREPHIFESLEDTHGPVRPMKLVEVDIVRLKPAEALVDRFIDLLRALPRQHGFVAEPIDLAAASGDLGGCLLYTSPSPRDRTRSRM